MVPFSYGVRKKRKKKEEEGKKESEDGGGGWKQRPLATARRCVSAPEQCRPGLGNFSHTNSRLPGGRGALYAGAEGPLPPSLSHLGSSAATQPSCRRRRSAACPPRPRPAPRSAAQLRGAAARPGPGALGGGSVTSGPGAGAGAGGRRRRLRAPQPAQEPAAAPPPPAAAAAAAAERRGERRPAPVSGSRRERGTAGRDGAEAGAARPRRLPGLGG